MCSRYDHVLLYNGDTLTGILTGISKEYVLKVSRHTKVIVKVK